MYLTLLECRTDLFDYTHKLVSFLMPQTFFFLSTGYWALTLIPSNLFALQNSFIPQDSKSCFVIYLRNKQSSDVAQELLCGGVTVRMLNWEDQISFYGK